MAHILAHSFAISSFCKSDFQLSEKKCHLSDGSQDFYLFSVISLIIRMKKLLDSDWLREVQFKCNTSAKSVTQVQKV